MKWIRRLGVLIALVAIVLVILSFYVDDLVKEAIEAGGRDALGVATTVDECDVGLFSGTFGLDGLRIANPEGYEEELFLSLGTAEVTLSLGALLSDDKIEIPELELRGVRVNLLHGVSGSNYGTIMANLENFQEAPAPIESDERRFAIHHLVVEDTEINVVPLKGLFTTVTIPIKRMEFRGLGSGANKGLLLAEVAGVLVEAILRNASVNTDMPALVGTALKSRLGKLTLLSQVGATVIGTLEHRLGKALPPGAVKGIKSLGGGIPGLGGKK